MNALSTESEAMQIRDSKTVNLRLHPGYVFREMLLLQRVYQEVFLGDIYHDVSAIQRWVDDVLHDRELRIYPDVYWIVSGAYCGFKRDYPNETDMKRTMPSAILRFEGVDDAPDLIRITRVY